MISVREQISKEWQDDLDTLIHTNHDILASYQQKQLEETRKRTKEQKKDKESDLETSTNAQANSTTLATQHHNLTLDQDPNFMLTNSISSKGQDSSPFRRSNFDLLVLLSTQESIHRVLKEYSQDPDEQEDFLWLKDFYTQRAARLFDGHAHLYGRADEFLKELFTAPPAAQSSTRTTFHLIDPMAMAEDILRERSDVAEQWKRIVSKIPQEHTDLRRLLLTRRMMESKEEDIIFPKPGEKLKHRISQIHSQTTA